MQPLQPPNQRHLWFSVLNTFTSIASTSTTAVSRELTTFHSPLGQNSNQTPYHSSPRAQSFPPHNPRCATRRRVKQSSRLPTLTHNTSRSFSFGLPTVLLILPVRLVSVYFLDGGINGPSLPRLDQVNMTRIKASLVYYYTLYDQTTYTVNDNRATNDTNR